MLRWIAYMLLCGCIASCGGGNDAQDAEQPVVATSLRGQVQKGPLIFGSRVWISELDTGLAPTGKVFSTQTADDLGQFEVASRITSNLLELVGAGYYLDELSGQLSRSPITLTAIADISVAPQPTINVLTTLQAPRLKKLILEGRNYSEAFDKSSREVLLAFGIDPAKMNGFNSLAGMQINGQTDQDAALLAASAILAQMATTVANTSGSSQPAELSYLLSRIGQEIAEEGRITSAAIIEARKLASRQVDTATVRLNVETYYASKGVPVEAPRLEEWVDRDSSGVLPRRLLLIDKLVLESQSYLVPNRPYRSNAVTVTGIPHGVAVPVSATQNTEQAPGWRLVKNGVPIESLPEWRGSIHTTAVLGDKIEVEGVVPYIASSPSTTLQIGASTATWTISADADVVAGRYRPDTINFVGQFVAVPVTVSDRVTARFVALADHGESDGAISIYTDENGMPGTQIAATTARDVVEGYNIDIPGGYSFYAFWTYLGDAGVVLEPGVTYWIVKSFRNGFGNRVAWSTLSSPGAPVSSDGITWSPSPGRVVQPGFVVLK